LAEVKFEKPTRSLLKYIADNMRSEDVAEVWASSEYSPQESLDNGMENSDFSVIVMIDGIPSAIVGLAFVNKVTGVGVPWLLSSKNMLKHKKLFLELSMPIIKEMLEICPYLVNHVYMHSRLSMRWLKWAGFIIEEPIPNEITGALFCRFSMRKEDV
jgi:hypothetical protein